MTFRLRIETLSPAGLASTVTSSTWDQDTFGSSWYPLDHAYNIRIHQKLGEHDTLSFDYPLSGFFSSWLRPTRVLTYPLMFRVGVSRDSGESWTYPPVAQFFQITAEAITNSEYGARAGSVSVSAVSVGTLLADQPLWAKRPGGSTTNLEYKAFTNKTSNQWMGDRTHYVDQSVGFWNARFGGILQHAWASCSELPGNFPVIMDCRQNNTSLPGEKGNHLAGKGEAWVDYISTTMPPGTTLQDILDKGYSGGYIDWRMWGRTLQVFNSPITSGNDYSGLARRRNVNLMPRGGKVAMDMNIDLTGAYRRVYLYSDNGWVVTRTYPGRQSNGSAFKAVFDRAVWVKIDVGKSTEEITAIARDVAGQSIRRPVSWKISGSVAATPSKPFVDYDCGCSADIPEGFDVNDGSTARISEIEISGQDGEWEFSVTMGSREYYDFLWWQQNKNEVTRKDMLF